MAVGRHIGWRLSVGLAFVVLTALAPAAPSAQRPGANANDVTFSKDIVPILQRSCENCHRPNGPGRGKFNALFDTAFKDMGICNEMPEHGDLKSG